MLPVRRAANLMPDSEPDALIAAPRVVLVLSGAVSEAGSPSTALEHAVMPNLAALARAGRVGRLRAIAGHLPAQRISAMAGLLGVVPPMAIDPAAVAARARGVVLGVDEGCTLVSVRSADGRPAPALEVHRAAQAFDAQLLWHRVVGRRRCHELLIAGPAAPRLPQLDGLQLEAVGGGVLPGARLNRSTVAVGPSRGTLIGVAGLLGAGVVVAGETPQPTAALERELRVGAIAALLGGAETVLVDVPSALLARRREQRSGRREQTVAGVLERVDRALIGPLWSAAAWAGASLVVTADVPVGSGARPLRGDVPIVTSAPRSVLLPEPAPLLAPAGTTAPPRYCERGIVGLPVVTSPLRLVPERATVGPRRFSRDPVSGRTEPGDRVVARRTR